MPGVICVTQGLEDRAVGVGVGVTVGVDVFVAVAVGVGVYVQVGTFLGKVDVVIKDTHTEYTFPL